MQDGLNPGMVLLQPLRHKIPIRTVLSASKRDSGCRWLGSSFGGKGPGDSWPVRLISVALGGYKWVQTVTLDWALLT